MGTQELLQGLEVWGSQPSQSAKYRFFASKAVKYKKAEICIAVPRLHT